MKRIISPLLAICFFCFQLNAQSIFLKYDESCMNRLEYSTGESANPYVSYSLGLKDNSVLLLDIGNENPAWQKNLPGKISYCNSWNFDREFALKVNNGTVKLYIVRESPTQYHVAAVDKVSLLKQQGNAIHILMDDTEFIMHTDNLVSQVNLAVPNARKEVYLEGIINMQCLTGYILQKKENATDGSYREYVYIPEIGIVERSAVSGYSGIANTSRSSTIKLNSVNNTAFKDVIAKTCDRIQATYYDGKNKSSLVAKTGVVPASYNNDPCAPSAIAGVHVVQKGETLYGIARRYGISLDQLSAWNKIQNTDMIAVCQKLYVKDPALVPGAVVTLAPDATVSAATPQLTEKTGAVAAGYWINAPEVFVVRAGDTVSGLATMFGYTEDRFRKMNALSPTENIYIGQKLRTSDCVCPTLTSTTKEQPLPYGDESAKITTADNQDVYFRPVKIHQIQKEDTLFSIAKMYDTTIERILELNGMKQGDKLSPDQKIYVQ